MKRIISLLLCAFLLIPGNIIFAADNATAAITDVTCQGTAPTIVKGFGIDTQRWNDDKASIFNDLDGMSFSENTYYIQTAKKDYATESLRDMTKEYLSFKINKSANIYLISSYSGSTSNNWSLSHSGYLSWATEANGWTPVRRAEAHDDGNPSIKLINSKNASDGNANSLTKSYLLKKTVYLPSDGNTTEIISLNGNGTDINNKTVMYSVIVEFLDDSVPTVSAITSTGTKPNLVKGFGIGTQRWSDDNKAVFTDIGGMSFLDNTYYFRTAREDYNNEILRDITSEYMSFKINRSANIYLVVNLSSVTSNYMSWATGAKGWSFVMDGDSPLLMSTPSNTEGSSANAFVKSYLLKKTVLLPTDGKTSELIILNGNGTDFQNKSVMYSVIVEFIDESAFLSDIKINGETINGFNSAVMEYDVYNIPATAEISWIVLDNSATVEKTVTDSAFILKVTSETSETTYTLNRLAKANDLRMINYGENKLGTSLTYNILENYSVTDSKLAYTGSAPSAFSDLDDFDTLLSDSKLTFIQTSFDDSKTIRDNFTQEEDLMTFAINGNANVYIVSPVIITPMDSAEWSQQLNDWELVTKEDGTPYYLSNDAGNNMRKHGYVYKKTFVTDSIEDYQTVTIKGITNTGVDVTNSPVYRILVEWLDDTDKIVTVNVSAGENGSVSNLGNNNIVSGESLIVNIRANEGYIPVVTVNGIEQAVDTTEAVTEFKLSDITADAVIRVEFEEKPEEIPDELPSLLSGYCSFEKQPILFNEKIYTHYGICFATAKAEYGTNLREEYGVLVSKENLSKEAFVVGAENVSKVVGQGISETGKYGILITGASLKTGDIYYARSYAIYNGKTIYGNIVPLTY